VYAIFVDGGMVLDARVQRRVAGAVNRRDVTSGRNYLSPCTDSEHTHTERPLYSCHEDALPVEGEEGVGRLEVPVVVCLLDGSVDGDARERELLQRGRGAERLGLLAQHQCLPGRLGETEL